MLCRSRRMTSEGVIVIEAKRFRAQDRNRQDALDRLVELIRQAAVPPKPRRPTGPTLGSKKRRIEAKTRRSRLQQGRRSRTEDGLGGKGGGTKGRTRWWRRQGNKK